VAEHDDQGGFLDRVRGGRGELGQQDPRSAGARIPDVLALETGLCAGELADDQSGRRDAKLTEALAEDSELLERPRPVGRRPRELADDEGMDGFAGRGAVGDRAVDEGGEAGGVGATSRPGKASSWGSLSSVASTSQRPSSMFSRKLSSRGAMAT
jgi:hypothetical protein